jgi:cobalt-zinc-cadmium efflux system outer membrane protein
VLLRRQVDIQGAQFADLVAAQQTLVTGVNTYLGLLGNLWSSVVSVADLLQTDDLFQTASPRGLSAVPDLDGLRPLPCCHPVGQAGAGAAVSPAVAPPPPAPVPPMPVPLMPLPGPRVGPPGPMAWSVPSVFFLFFCNSTPAAGAPDYLPAGGLGERVPAAAPDSKFTPNR